MRTLLPLVVLPLAVAACGSGTSGSPPPQRTTTMSESEFVAAGNKVCVTSDRRMFAIGRLTRDPTGWGKAVRAARAAVRAMGKVSPPADRAAAFRRMLRYANAVVATTERVHTALLARRIAVATATQHRGARLEDEVHAAARAAGLTFCQQALTNWPA